MRKIAPANNASSPMVTEANTMAWPLCPRWMLPRPVPKRCNIFLIKAMSASLLIAWGANIPIARERTAFRQREVGDVVIRVELKCLTREVAPGAHDGLVRQKD